MKKILVINASARTLKSHSRKLTEVFVDYWKSAHPDSVVTFRELGNAEVPHISQNWITAAFKPPATRSDQEKDALKLSDVYISELREADVIVLGSPMYNWSIPSTLKAYIDQIMRVNETWKIDPDNVRNPYVGLLENKTLFLVLSRGSQGYEKGGYNEHMDFQSGYLKTVFNIMGVSNIHLIALNGASMHLEKLETSVEKAHQEIRESVDLELVLPETTIKSITF